MNCLQSPVSPGFIRVKIFFPKLLDRVDVTCYTKFTGKGNSTAQGL